MYDRESVKALSDALHRKSNEYLQNQRIRDAITLLTAQQSLEKWLDADLNGDIPGEMQALQDFDWRSYLRPEEKTKAGETEATPSGSFGSGPDSGSANISIGNTSRDRLSELRPLLDEGKLEEAAILLERLVGETTDPAQRQELETYRNELLSRRRQQLEEAEKEARAYQRQHPDDHQGQRRRWQAILSLSPEHREATGALADLDRLDLGQDAYQELRQIRSQLPNTRQRIDLVENDRTRVNQMRYDPDLENPDVQREVQRLYDELSTIRDDIIKVSEGGTSGERSQQYEQAITVYRNAIRAGYTQILDDSAGGYIDPDERLKITLAARDRDYIARTSARYNEAEAALRDGTPEVAVDRLTEADKLISIIESGADEWRTKVQQLLDEAQSSVRSKERAAALVAESENSIDPRQAKILLLRAREAYANYPRLAERINQKERQMIDRVMVEMLADRRRAEAHMDDRRFDLARSEGEAMLRRGNDLDFIPDNVEYRQLRKDAEELLGRINEGQRKWQRLQERLENVRKALAIPDLPLARQFLEGLVADHSDSPEVVELRTRVLLLGNNEEKWKEAQQHFNQLQNLEQVVSLCDSLMGSPEYVARAQELQRRARARLWSQQARETGQRGKREEALALYNRVQDLRGQLPGDDQHLIDAADAEAKALTTQLSEAQRLRQRLDAARSLRERGLWAEWDTDLKKLEKESGTLLLSDIHRERGQGTPLWLEKARSDAESALVSQDPERWRKAYEILHPLYRLGAIEDGDRTYRQIAYNYHQFEAERRQVSANPQDLEKAVEHLRNLQALAEPPGLEERRKLHAGIRSYTLRLAQSKAAGTGPKTAVAALKEQMRINQLELQEDVEVRSYLIHYALLAEEFDVARSAAEGLQHLPDAREEAQGWLYLVQVAERFNQETTLEAWEKELPLLNEARESAKEGGLLQESLNGFTDRMSNLRHSLLQSPNEHSNEKMLERVRSYALILQLRPDDRRARDGVNQLADRLVALGNDVNNRVRRLLNEDAGDVQLEVAQLTSLDGEIGALVQAFQLLGEQQTDTAQLLIQNRRNAQRRSQELQEYHRLFGELEIAYRRAINERWETIGLDSALQAAVRVARNLNMNRQAGQWEEKVRKFKETLEDLNHILEEMERAWVNERYADVKKQCDNLENSLRRGRSVLNEKGLSLPPDAIDLYDAHTRRNLNSLESVRSAAQEKEQNLTQWRRWVQRFEELQGKISERETECESHLRASPPCLSAARESLAHQLRLMQELARHLGENSPPTPLTNEASRFARQIEEGNLRERIAEEIGRNQERLIDIDEKIDTVERPISQLRAFMSGNINMQQGRNQSTFKLLAEPIRQIDSCHPDLVKLIERFERLAKINYADIR